MLEFFSGKGNATRAFRAAGKCAASYEINDHECMDFMSPGGFALLGCIKKFLLNMCIYIYTYVKTSIYIYVCMYLYIMKSLSCSA